MDDPDRQAVLDALVPEELFGEDAADPRALRRAYAVLAKRYKADAEVFTHIRSLYEAARDGVPRALPVRPTPTADAPEEAPAADAPEPQLDQRHPAQVLHEAMEAADLQRAYDVIATNPRMLIADAPGLLEHVVHVLIEGVGSRLSHSPLDVLESVIDDPTWDLPPDLAIGWRVRIGQSRALWAAEEDPGLESLVDALRRTWSAPPQLAAPIWLELAAEYREAGTDLDALFARLELDHPTVLGQVRITERRMLTLAELRPVELPEAATEAQYQGYQPSSAVMEHWWTQRARAADGPTWVAFRIFAFIGILVLLVSSRVLGLAAGLATWWVLKAQQPTQAGAQAAFDRVHALDLEPLLAFCRDHALFPRELAARVYGGAVPMSNRTAFLPTHPLYRLDRSDAGVLRVIGPEHVARLEQIAAELAQAAPEESVDER